MNEWTVYDGTNPPTDTSKHVLWEVEYPNGELGTISWAKDSAHRSPLSTAKRWKYIEPYQPELLPCRCGGEAYSAGGLSERIGCENACGIYIEGRSNTEAIRMWNAAMLDDVKTSEMLNRMTAGNAAKPEPNMPETAWLTDDYVRGQHDKYRCGEWNDSKDNGFKHPYIKKSKYDEVVEQRNHAWNERDKLKREAEIRNRYREQAQEPKVCRWTLKGRNWDMSCRPNGWTAHMNHPIVDSYKHCPCCGKPIEVER
jgi:hypothetical protein